MVAYCQQLLDFNAIFWNPMEHSQGINPLRVFHIKRRSFTKEFKVEILKQIEVRPLVEVCREHELLPAIVMRWKREFEGNPTLHLQEKVIFGKKKPKWLNVNGRLVSCMQKIPF